jgi:glycosyltransferase involved in cell wall biosynthesis
MEISSRLEEFGWKVEFITTSGGFAALSSRVSARFHVVRSSVFGRQEKTPLDRLISYSIATIFSIFVILRLGKLDLVYSDTDYFCDVIPAVLVRLRWKTRWVAMSHHFLNPSKFTDFGQFLSSISALFQRLSFALFRMYADSVFVLDSDGGREVAEYLTIHGFDSKRIGFVMNGVDLELIRQFDSYSTSSIYDACFIGGIRPRKGTDELLSIWSEVVSRIPNALLLVVGGGLQSYERVLRERIVEKGLQANIVIAGHVPSKQLILYLKSSKLFISPSREEGWGIALCEAMACGTPVVAYDLPAYRTFGNSLIKITLGDTIEFARNVATVIEDKETRERLSKLGKIAAAEFDWDDIAKRESVAFQNLISER